MNKINVELQLPASFFLIAYETHTVSLIGNGNDLCSLLLKGLRKLSRVTNGKFGKTCSIKKNHCYSSSVS